MSVMYGADADELEAFAAELEGHREELGQLLLQGVGAVSLVGLSSTLHTLWRGPRAADFSAVWQSRHLLQVRGVQDLLSAAINDLRANAEHQRLVSATSAVSGASSAGQALAVGEADLFRRALGQISGVVKAGEWATEAMLLVHSRHVVRGLNGTFRAAGTLSKAQLFGHVFRHVPMVAKAHHGAAAAAWRHSLHRLHAVGAVVDGTIAGWQEWLDSGEDPSRSDLVRLDRAVTVGTYAGTGALAGGIAGAKVGAATGAVIGSVFPGPGTAVGAAVGGIVGSTVGALVGSELGEHVGGYVADAREYVFEEAGELVSQSVEAAGDIVEAGIDVFDDAADAVGGVISGGADVASDIGNALKFWD